MSFQSACSSMNELPFFPQVGILGRLQPGHFHFLGAALVKDFASGIPFGTTRARILFPRAWMFCCCSVDKPFPATCLTSFPAVSISNFADSCVCSRSLNGWYAGSVLTFCPHA